MHEHVTNIFQITIVVDMWSCRNSFYNQDSETTDAIDSTEEKIATQGTLP